MLEKITSLLYEHRYWIVLTTVLGFVYLWENKTLLYDISSSLWWAFLGVQTLFNTICDFDSFWAVWSPFLIITVGVLILMMKYPTPPPLLRIFLVVGLFGAHTIYVVFRTFNTLRFDTLGNSIATLIFWFSDVLFYVCSVTLYIQFLFPIDRRAAADEYEKAITSGAFQPWVDIFITTCSEPVEIVLRTAIAATMINYKNIRIHILDDGNGTIDKEQVEKGGFDWIEVATLLLINGWATSESLTKVRLTINLDDKREEMSKVFGEKYSEIEPILRQARSRPEIQKIAQDLGIDYITRSGNEHAKAGNINNALKHSHGEFIAIFDADCIPLKNFLNRTIGFFQEPEVGMVIAAQSFYNAEMYSHNVMSLMELSRIFRHSQCGRDRFNALLCYGTCFVVRREALEKIGGIPTETLAEDWALSIMLQAAGYKTYSLDEVLGLGAVAESMGEYVKQRVRWTQGTLQSLFASTNPLRIKGLSLMQRIIHTYGILHYLLNPFYIMIIIVPLLYLFFGIVPLYYSQGQFTFFFLPFLSLSCLTFSWICREYTSKLSSIVGESFMAIPLSNAAIKTLWRPFGRLFRVTVKGIYREKAEINWVTAGPLIVMLILMVMGILCGYFARHWYESAELFYCLFLMIIFRIVAVWIGVYSSFDLPQKRRNPRFQHKLRCVLTGREQISGTTVDISEKGLLMQCDKKLDESEVNDAIAIDIPDLGIHQLTAKVVRASGSEVALFFNVVPNDPYKRLVDFLYCYPREWDHGSDLDIKVLKALVKAWTFKGIDWSFKPKKYRVAY